MLAGAGSGKTRVLTHRIAWLVGERGISPYRILALTFTNKAAGEMKERVEQLIGAQASLWIGTFHSICARILRRDAECLGYTRNYSIYDTDDSKRLIKNILKELPSTFDKINPNSVRHAISRYKNSMRGPEEIKSSPGRFLESQIAEIYDIYTRKLKENNAMDFDDLILKPLELFREAPEVLERYRRRFDHILIDEFQDTNRVQYNLVRLLADERLNVCVVGDDDQSIYGWRGAEVRNIYDFERDYGDVRTVRLEQNYRSTGTILDVAHSVVSRIAGRKAKKLWTEKPSGARAVVLQCRDELDEADQIASHASMVRGELGLGWRHLAVLYRTNAQSRALEEACRRQVVPYRIIGGLRFYERKEIRDLMAYLKVIANPQDSGSLYRIINVPARGIGPATLSRLTALANSRGEPLYHVLGDADQAEGVGGKTAERIMQLHTDFEQLRDLSRTGSAVDVLTELLRLTAYEESLAELDTVEAQSRLDNIQELVNAAGEFSESWDPESEGTCLESWLAETSLLSEIDFHDPEQEYLTLMTLHNAKGLEFPVVFIAGVEENLLPLGRSLEDETGSALEEERRLFYVGITRAMERLYLSWAASRRRYGDILEAGPSGFLTDIPEEYTDIRSSLRSRADSFSGYGRKTYSSFFGKKRSGPVGAPPPLFGQGNSRSSGKKSGEQESATESGPVFVPDEGVDEPAYRKGERVVHNKFGSGTITAVSHYLDDLRLTVRFDSGFSKKLVARFARLRRED